MIVTLRQTLVVALGIGVVACGGEAGRRGFDGLVMVTDADVLTCPNGGNQVNVGRDKNRNGVLDGDEIESSWPVCAGLNGTAPTNGTIGVNGLIATAATPPDDTCLFGGVTVMTGGDSDADGILDDSERAPDQHYCSAQAASFSGVVFTASSRFQTSPELYAVGADGLALRKLAAAATSDARVDSSFEISPNRRQVAFCAILGFDGLYGLYLASLVSDQPPTLIARGSSFACQSFAWAPKYGERLAYIDDDGATTTVPRLYTVAADGQGRVELTAGQALSTDSSIVSFTWAADDSSLAYLVKLTSTVAASLFIIPATGLASDGTGRSVSLTEAFGTAASLDFFEVSWSPTGAYVAFAADPVCNDWPNLYTVSVANPSTVTKVGGVAVVADCNTSIAVDSFKWSPDGRLLAYRGRNLAGRSTVSIVEPSDASGGQDVTGEITSASYNGVHNLWGWSADSAAIAFDGKLGSDNLLGLYTVSAASHQRATVYSPGASFFDCAWSPVAAHLGCRVLADNSGVSTQLWVIPASGVAAGSQVNGNIPDGHMGVGSFHWSPDGTQLAYIADPIKNLMEVFLVPAAGGAPLRVSPEGLVGSGASAVMW